MDAIIPVALSALAILGLVATLAGVESRDGFDRGSLNTFRSHEEQS